MYGFSSLWMLIAKVLKIKRFIKWSHFNLWILFVNGYKCNCTSLVVVVHSLHTFLEQIHLFKALGRLIVEYISLNHIEVL